MTSANQPFFLREGDRYTPTSAARGPWDPKSLHGRVIVALLAHEIEAAHMSSEFIPARLTVDMYQLPDLSPIAVTTRVVRAGNRIKVVDAEFFSAGKSMARATCQLLKRTANPEGKIWSPPNWSVPAPAQIPPPPDRAHALGGMWAMRPITGQMGELGQRRTWMSEVRALVDEVALTPFVRVACAADFASPFANGSDVGLRYINSDVTLYLHRLPIGEWIGFEVVNHHATEGVAIAECWVYDEHGAIGSSSVAALAQRRAPSVGLPATNAASKSSSGAG